MQLIDAGGEFGDVRLIAPPLLRAVGNDLISFGADALAGDGSGSTTAVNSFPAEDFKDSSKYPEQTGDDVTNFTRN